MFVKPIVVGNNFTNCYLVGDEKGKGIIIDPGAEPEKIYKVAEENEMEITGIVNTHGHFDHIKGNDFLKQKLDVPLMIHQKGEKLLTNPEKNLSGLLAGSLGVVSPEADRLLKEDEKVKAGSYSFQVLFTPGHSPDSISLYCSEEDVLFSGDTIFKTGIGRTDFPGAEKELIFSSIANKLMVLPGSIKVYPGHGPQTTIGKFKANIWKRLRS